MSIMSWKKEFYNKLKKRMTDKECAEHTLKKYTGVLTSNLIKHKVIKRLDSAYIEDEKYKDFHFNMDNCSFCVKYILKERICSNCPLFIEGKKTCFDENSAYGKFYIKSNPKKMISLLNKILKKCNKIGKYNYKKIVTNKKEVN